MICLPDVNVWLALAVGQHVHHPAAKRWFDGAVDARLAFCRITETGLLRLLTNARVMDGDPLPASAAWRVRDQFFTDSRIVLMREPDGFTERWRETAKAGRIGPNFWTDAYLVRFCASIGSTLVTFDQSLSRQKHCPVRILSNGS